MMPHTLKELQPLIELEIRLAMQQERAETRDSFYYDMSRRAIIAEVRARRILTTILTGEALARQTTVSEKEIREIKATWAHGAGKAP